MPRQPPRFLPTVALAALWVALYFLWVAVRPEVVVTAERRPGTSVTTTPTTVPPLLKFKP